MLNKVRSVSCVSATASKFFLMGALVAPSLATAEVPERWELPPPGAMMDATKELCSAQAKNALDVVLLRDKGQTMDSVLSLIPDSPKAFPFRLVSVMRENTEDAFRYPDLSIYTLYSFRSEVCFRETLGAVRMPRLETVVSQIAACQKQQGPEKSIGLFKCIQTVVRSVTPLQQ